MKLPPRSLPTAVLAAWALAGLIIGLVLNHFLARLP